ARPLLGLSLELAALGPQAGQVGLGVQQLLAGAIGERADVAAGLALVGSGLVDTAPLDAGSLLGLEPLKPAAQVGGLLPALALAPANGAHAALGGDELLVAAEGPL